MGVGSEPLMPQEPDDSCAVFSTRCVFALLPLGQGDQRQDRRQLTAFALGLAGIGHPVLKIMPERRQLIG